jgi:replication factor C subunit 3/5
MSSDGELPHILFYGPTGGGKKTRCTGLLRSTFGPSVDKLRLDSRTFTTPSNKTLSINLISSAYHIELTPSDAGIYDRYVVNEVIKEMASHQSLSTIGGADVSKEVGGNKKQFKVVVLNDVDRLSKQAQAGLRRTMEKYTSSCRLILLCSNQSKVIEPLRSRCLGIRVASPTIDEIASVVTEVGKKENLTVSPELATRIANESNRNLRRALLMLETAAVSNPNQSNLSSVAQPLKVDWELYIESLARDIVAEQSPAKLLLAREKLYELLINCIPATVILKTLLDHLLLSIDDDLKHVIVESAAFYEQRMVMGSKEIFHLEAFVAKFMCEYKRYLTSLFG